MINNPCPIPSPEDKLTPATCTHILNLMERCLEEAQEGLDYGDPYEKIWNEICDTMLKISGQPVPERDPLEDD